MTKDEYRSELGARLRRERSYRDLSQNDVRRAVGISQSKLSRIERGSEGIELEELLALAGLYDVPLATLLDDLVPLAKAPLATRASPKGRAQALAA
jgi:transcriptional regulator with XRE-family HTH domain